MLRNLNANQVTFRGILQQLFPYASGKTLDILLQSIDSDLTVPLRVDATSTPSLVVDVGPAIVSNPISSRQKSIFFINNLIPTFVSGTVTFPSANGGNITTSTGGSNALVLPANDYVKVLLSMDPLGNILTVAGTPAASSTLAIVPIPSSSASPFAYVLLFNNAGTIQNVTQDHIFQFAGGGGGSGGGGGVAQEVPLTIGTTTKTITLITPQSSANYVVIAQIANLVDVNPEYIPVTIISRTTTNFEVEWNAPLPTGNYKLDYLIGPGIVEQVGEAVVNIGDASTTVTISIPMNSLSYVVSAEFANYVDVNPEYIPITVTNKSLSSFTLKWNAPLPTSNYRIAWQIASFQ